MPPRKRKNARAVKPEPADPAVSSEMQSIIDELEAEVRQRTEELQAQKAELVRAGRLECLRLILGLPAEVRETALSEIRQEAKMLATQQDLGDDSELTYLLEKLEACLPPESDAAPAPAKAGPKGRRKESAAQTGKRAGGRRAAPILETPHQNRVAPAIPRTSTRLPKPGEVLFSANGSPLMVLGDNTKSQLEAVGMQPPSMAKGLHAHIAGQSGENGPPTPKEVTIALQGGRQITLGVDKGLENMNHAELSEVAAHMKLVSRLAKNFNLPGPSPLGK